METGLVRLLRSRYDREKNAFSFPFRFLLFSFFSSFLSVYFSEFVFILFIPRSKMKYSNHLFPSFTHTNLSAMVIFLINISVLPGFTISWSICVHTCSHVCEASNNADDKLGNIINIFGDFANVFTT